MFALICKSNEAKRISLLSGALTAWLGKYVAWDQGWIIIFGLKLMDVEWSTSCKLALAGSRKRATKFFSFNVELTDENSDMFAFIVISDYVCINSTRHATLKNSVPGRVFCFYIGHFLAEIFICMFSKPPLTIEQQVFQLKERGLIISAEDNIEHYLSHISYYRLAGYWWPMQSDKENHIFKPHSKFPDIIALYNFDRELRLLLFDVIEKLEISLRTKLIYHLSHEFDPWWFQNTSIFINTSELIKTLHAIDEEIDRSKDTFIKEHKKKHGDDLRFPPCWKSLELTSFGSLSKLYGNLKNTVKSKDIIAEEFGTVNHTYLPSWLQSIAQIRNYCAHHSRLWNRESSRKT